MFKKIKAVKKMFKIMKDEKLRSQYVDRFFTETEYDENATNYNKEEMEKLFAEWALMTILKEM